MENFGFQVVEITHPFSLPPPPNELELLMEIFDSVEGYRFDTVLSHTRHAGHSSNRGLLPNEFVKSMLCALE